MSARSDWTRREVLQALCVFGLSTPAFGWLAACGSGGKQAQPPEIDIDRDECDWCRMTIDDRRLAAAFVPTKGRVQRFGEPGCLLAWLAGHTEVEGSAFVAAQEDGGWLAAGSARFGRGLIRTPMRFDLAAWRREPSPEAERLTWAELLGEGMPYAHRG